MRIRSFVAAVVLVSFATALTAQGARAADSPSTTAPAHVDFDRAIARVVTQQSQGDHPDPLHTKRSNPVSMQYGPGGGGGHMMMVMSIVGMLAGVGMTYYMIKQVQKTTNQAKEGQ